MREENEEGTKKLTMDQQEALLEIGTAFERISLDIHDGMEAMEVALFELNSEDTESAIRGLQKVRDLLTTNLERARSILKSPSSN